MVLEISMYFEEIPIGILVPFPIFFSSHFHFHRGECIKMR